MHADFRRQIRSKNRDHHVRDGDDVRETGGKFTRCTLDESPRRPPEFFGIAATIAVRHQTTRAERLARADSLLTVIKPRSHRTAQHVIVQRTNNAKPPLGCSSNYTRRERFGPQMQVNDGVFRPQAIQQSARNSLALDIPQSLRRGAQPIWIVQNLILIRAVYGKTRNRKQLRRNWRRGRQKFHMIPATSQSDGAA